jgi:hypothetical protein
MLPGTTSTTSLAQHSTQRATQSAAVMEGTEQTLHSAQLHREAEPMQLEGLQEGVAGAPSGEGRALEATSLGAAFVGKREQLLQEAFDKALQYGLRAPTLQVCKLC